MLGKNNVIKTVLKNLPQEENCFYYETFSPKLIFHLNKHQYEAFREENSRSNIIWEATRNEPKSFFGKLKKIKFSQENIEKYTKKVTDLETGCYQPCKDYLDTAISEFIIQYMKTKVLWEKARSDFESKADRIKHCYIIKQDLVATLKAYNGRNTLIYWQEPDGLKESEQEKYSAFFATIFKGKVIFVSKDTNKIYKGKFNSWKKFKCNNYHIWKNY